MTRSVWCGVLALYGSLLPSLAFASVSLKSYFDDWSDRVSAAQNNQPRWVTPLMTVTPRLEQEFRYDQYWEKAGNGASIDSFDSGKGLELIPTTTNEIIVNLPAFLERRNVGPASGWGDWPALLIKQRLLSAPEASGNYVVSIFLGFQAPTGSTAFTNQAWTITPTLAFGKGWGNFDVQATIGAAIPMSRRNVIGTAVNSNLSLQYHLARYLWPEVEFNDTRWSGGARKGLNQLFMTAGMVLGRYEITPHAKLLIGGGYQFALSPRLIRKPIVTPVYDHNFIMSVRLGF